MALAMAMIWWNVELEVIFSCLGDGDRHLDKSSHILPISSNLRAAGYERNQDTALERRRVYKPFQRSAGQRIPKSGV